MDRNEFKNLEIRFITGSQHLYGEETLRQVAENSRRIVDGLNAAGNIPVKIVWQPAVKTPGEITDAMRRASADPQCVGVIAWMHTFSPAKMWINGLKILQKPMLHLHTQTNREIPWSTIDMDFMNLNQSAHGDREFGYICTRLNIARKVVVGYWADDDVQAQIGIWARVAAAWNDSQTMRVARIGDNMREVAVTEGNKVDAQIQFGYSVNGYGISDFVKYVNAVNESQIDDVVQEYFELYTVPGKDENAMRSIRDAARQEIAMRMFMKDGGFSALTTTFEDLTGLYQLPGMACQRLMADGFGFGAEGDWKTSALLHTMKYMARGLSGGTSFMEDYTYHLERGRERALASHMLEVCPSIAEGKPSLEVHPLGIGGKADPARLVFDVPEGPAIAATLVEFGDRFRLIVNEVETVKPDAALPKLPVARAVWIPKPDFKTAVQAWIQAGGAHHSVYSQSLTTEYMVDFAEMAGIELVVIR